MVGLQQHFDMLAFSLASRESVKEADYDRHSKAPKIMPAANRHQNFEQMQAYARDLMLRQIINDALNLAVSGMNNAHFFLALVKVTKGDSNVDPVLQKEAQELQQAFLQAPLDQKFDLLEKNYGIMCELEDTITGLGFVIQALLKQGGEVKEAQLDKAGELALDLKAIKVFNREMESEKPKAKLVDQRKVFREFEVIRFTDVELQQILVTVASFADALFKSVAAYAKKLRDKGND